MSEKRTNWPLIAGVATGVLCGLVAGISLYSANCSDTATIKLRSAEEIIKRCRDKISEIESGIEALREAAV